MVDKPEPGKTYGQVGGVPYEWREEDRDKSLWEESPIKTGWWMRRLYQRKKSVEPGNADGKGAGKGLDEGADKASDKGSDKGSAKEPVTGPDDKLPTSGGTPNATPDGKKQKGRRGTAKGLNAEDKGVVMHLAEVLDADKG
ncbi:MAG TPA: hypothetical protein VIC62_03310, partial [Nakamurella sp.]